MNAMSWTKENKGLWLAVACGVAAFGMLTTVLGSQPAERTGTVTVMQVFDADLGSMVVEGVRQPADLGTMVVEAERPSSTEVVSNASGSTQHDKKGERALQLAVGF